MAKVLDLDEAMAEFARLRLGGKPTPSKPSAKRYGPRHVPDEMNKTEAKYANILFARRHCGEIVDYRFESVKIRLAEDKCWLTMDFAVWFPDGTVELIDVKGGGPAQEKNLIKLKVAADKYRGLWRFAIERLVGKNWERREF